VRIARAAGAEPAIAAAPRLGPVLFPVVDRFRNDCFHLHSFSSPPPANTGEKQAKVDNPIDIIISTSLFHYDIRVKGFGPFLVCPR
jgi:hypothetical protein